MNRKDFVFNAGVLIFLNLLIKPFWLLGIDIGIQNRVGAEAYGMYFAIFNFTFLLNMLLDMGVTNFNNRNIAQNTQLLSKHISGILTLKLALGGIYLATALAIGFIIGYDRGELTLLIAIAINQFFNALTLYFRSNISALLLIKTDSILSILDRVIMVVICSYLLWFYPQRHLFTIEWYVYSQTVAYIITSLVAFFIILQKTQSTIRLRWNLPFFTVILKKSFPFALLYLLMSLYCRIDSVMIERMLPAEIGAYEAGIYASAFRLLDAAVMVAYLLSVILLPLFSKMLKSKENLTPIIHTSFTLLYFYAATTISILVFNRAPLMELLYTNHASESAVVFLILFPCLLPMSLSYIFGTLLTANGSMKWLNIMALAGIFVNIIINLILIPRLGGAGAAVASLTTQSVVAIIQIVIAFTQLKLSIKSFRIKKCILYTLFVIPMAYLLTLWNNDNVIYTILTGGGIAMVIALLTKLLPLSMIRELMQRRSEEEAI